MNRQISVHSLITVPDEKSFAACTLVMDSIRVGFPTSHVTFHINYDLTPPDLAEAVINKVNKISPVAKWWFTVGTATYQRASVHHAYWIKRVVENHAAYDPPGPLVIVDGDTHFWKSCEYWTFDSLFAGYYVPYIWNDFAKCPSFPRLHTSFMWFEDTAGLIGLIQDAYPPAVQEHGEYCPLECFMPGVRFIDRQAFFWDSCAGLFNAIGGQPFAAPHLEFYEHLNSASFFNVMHNRLEAQDAFEFLHTHAPKNMEQFRGQIWPIVNEYYQRKHVQAKLRVPIDWR